MKLWNLTGGKLLALGGLAASALAMGALSLPTGTAAFSTIGGSLGLAQRDFRVFNNFGDASANNNNTPHVNFPGHAGAVMAIWKGHDEWASEPVGGTGLGDGVASNPIIGSGNANFDNTFQGTTASAGTNNSNVHSEIPGSDGGTLAFTITPISDGWTIKYFAAWTWHDGPGSVSSGSDIQGVACHEIGHSLGLGHSNAGGTPTMGAFISGSGVVARSIEADDIAGVQSIYGVKSGTKPRITGLAGSKQIGQSLTINGTNFSASNGEVWFTKTTSDGNPTKVTNVNSSGGGTQIVVTIPSGVQDGQVHVKTSGSTNSSLSNGFPIDIGAAAGSPPTVNSINPTQGPAAGFTVVTISGSGFNGATSVKFDATDALSFNVDSDLQITATTPPGPLFDFADVTVTDGDGSSTLPSIYFWFFNPVVNITAIDPANGPVDGGTQVSITGTSVLSVTDVTFDGVSGTLLDIVSPTELTVFTPPGSVGPADVVAIGDNSSTIVDGFTYMAAGSFTVFGTGVPGFSTEPPALDGSGDLTPGSGTGFTLLTSGALPLSPATMFISLVQGNVPFKGGTLYTFPILVSISIPTNLSGTISLPAQVPLGTPGGTMFFIQTWVQDSSGPAGLAATNGLKVTTP